jgi:hypothetical protein
VTLGLNGAYQFTTSITGNAEVAAKASHWLRRKSTTVMLTSGQTTIIGYTLINGDCDGDNEVGIGDYAILSAAFNSTPGDPNWDEEADLNGDGEVNIGDYAVLSGNFNQVGD